ncbi:uncharacterized protein LOC107767046 [Nicotiana tabacum]|uniref:BZIP domain-containing protein n=2 Tax=Nicotiana tabacum TaxID=4097 RepID=A0A1S3XN93_TOBAC|nr:PREDICTED: uncharacterized protein LOC107767046 [Nicotiana tabacum]XP_016441446.1 PREDICTED: uncharacterized protein LOC107767046 [Nicotiana tabacum]XP_016441447.1 PREDICTED: uncharacterized protein LOC107767046 [Nicotiana tabacum]XP_016441448.1 PREDICTED: uncharacterized protein LOC107767046 [Nicotiana tabacum]
MDVPVKKPQDNGQKTSINDDVLARRLKNRERQRRYRERKRLKADTMRVLGSNQLASVPVEVPVIAAPQYSVLPVNVTPLDSSMPVNVASLDSSVPVNVAPREYVMPMNVAPLDSSVPVNVAPREYVMPVNVTPLDSSVPVNVAPREYVMPVNVATGKCVMPVSSASRESVTRVYSGRKWKCDARKAHAMRQKEVSSNGSVTPDLASTGGSQIASLPQVEPSNMALSNVISSPVTALENSGTPKSIPSRRHWKTEARNKKS